MATGAFKVDYLAELYPELFTGRGYRGLMSAIVAQNQEAIAKAVARKQTRHFKEQVERMGEGTTRLDVPDLADVLPKRSVFIRKAAHNGQALTDSQRKALSKMLRDTVAEWLQTGENSMQYQSARMKGRMNPKLIESFYKKINGYFREEGRASAKTIAVTEVRATVNTIKHEYVQRLAEKNPGTVKVMKTWRHNAKASKVSRPSHVALNGKRIPMSAVFMVTTPMGRGRVDVVQMAHPHDPNAPAEAVINCSCEIDYTVKVV